MSIGNTGLFVYDGETLSGDTWHLACVAWVRGIQCRYGREGHHGVVLRLFLMVLVLLGAFLISPTAWPQERDIDLSFALGLNGSSIRDSEHHAWDFGTQFAYLDDAWELGLGWRNTWEKDADTIERDNHIDASLAYGRDAWRVDMKVEWRHESRSGVLERDHLQSLFSLDYRYSPKFAININHEINDYRVRDSEISESGIGIKYRLLEGCDLSVHGEWMEISNTREDFSSFDVQFAVDYEAQFTERLELDLMLSYSLSGDGRFEYREIEFEGELEYQLSERVFLALEAEANNHYLSAISHNVDYRLQLKFTLL